MYIYIPYSVLALLGLLCKKFLQWLRVYVFLSNGVLILQTPTVCLHRFSHCLIPTKLYFER